MLAFATSGAVILASLATAVSGHGYIVDPAAVWTQGYASNGYISEVNSTLWGAVDNSAFGYGVEATVKYFTKNFPTSGYTSLRDLILANQDMYDESTDKECGLTTLDEAKRTTMPASGNITFSGFTHPGPCELWCDDNKLTFANDCAASYPDGKVPFDAANCVGANRFRIFWIGVHGSPWQVYTNCVYLEGGSGSSSSSSASTRTTTTTTPTTTTATPAATTATPTAATVTPTATTTTPVTEDSDATPTPSPTTKKNCTRRRK